MAVVSEPGSRTTSKHLARVFAQVVRFAVATVLLTAAGLKAHALATRPILESGLLGARWIQIAAVEAEFALATWLFSGIALKWAWRIAIAFFATFFCVAGYKVLTGQRSCGCFGTVEINPWITASFDFLAVAGFLLTHQGLENRASRRRVAITLAMAPLIGIPSGIAMTRYSSPTFTADGKISDEDKIVVLEPQKWIGKPLPLLRFVNDGENLSGGKWTIILYHHDCFACQDGIPKFLHSFDRATKGGSPPNIALIEVPPFGESDSLVLEGAPCSRYRLNEAREWFVQTPVVLKTTDGVVNEVSQQLQSP